MTRANFCVTIIPAPIAFGRDRVAPLFLYIKALTKFKHLA